STLRDVSSSPFPLVGVATTASGPALPRPLNKAIDHAPERRLIGQAMDRNARLRLGPSPACSSPHSVSASSRRFFEIFDRGDIETTGRPALIDATTVW